MGGEDFFFFMGKIFWEKHNNNNFWDDRFWKKIIPVVRGFVDKWA